MKKDIYIASDHAGFELKKILIDYLKNLNSYTVTDLGPYEYEPLDDYPDTVTLVADKIQKDENALGIVIGGSGQGEAMVVNKYRNLRCALWYGGNLEIVSLARQHNHAQVLSLGARFISEEQAKDAVLLFLETNPDTDSRHIRRILKMHAKEN